MNLYDAKYLALEAAEFLLPDAALLVDEWSDKFAYIPPENGAEGGPYQSARTPFARGVLRALSPDHPARRVVVMGASQLLKTQSALNWIAASIDCAPANFIAAMPSGNLAKRLSNRIANTFKYTSKLDGKYAPPRSRSGRNSLDTKEFNGGTLYIVSAGSAKNLAEVPARYVYGDEVDRWEFSLNKEGDPVDIIEARQTTYGARAKSFFTSSPTVLGFSKIHSLFLRGNQQYFHVPCPECGHMHMFDEANLKAETGGALVHHAWMVCPECAIVIEEPRKTKMMESGDWVASAPGDGETWSFQISSLYSPLGWMSWKSLASQRLNADIAAKQNNFEPRQVLVNTRWAKPYDPGTAMTTAEAMHRRADEYPLRSVPGGCILTCAVDVQADYLDLAVLCWGLYLECWVIERLIIPGSPAQADTWKALDEYLARPFFRDGVEMRIKAVAIDTGYSSHDVYNYIRGKKNQHVIGIKGANRPNKPVIAAKPTKVDVRFNGTVEPEGCELWTVGTDTCKQYWWDRWALSEGPGAIHFTKALGMPYFDGLMAEKRMVRQKGGRRVVEWVKPPGARNEPLDQVNYNLACAYYLGLHRLQEEEWKILEDRLKVAPVSTAPQPVSTSQRVNTRESERGGMAPKNWLNSRR